MSERRFKRRFFDPRFVSQERRRIYILACILFWSILAFFFINHFVFATVEVLGSSMYPTLRDGERCIMRRWPVYLREPARGDIAALRLAPGEDLVVKRIIALPGETVHLSNGRVFVNGEPLDEPYLPDNTPTFPARYGSEPLALPGNAYFVLGDNRSNSEDSRYYGPIPRRNITGIIRP